MRSQSQSMSQPVCDWANQCVTGERGPKAYFYTKRSQGNHWIIIFFNYTSMVPTPIFLNTPEVSPIHWTDNKKRDIFIYATIALI